MIDIKKVKVYSNTKEEGKEIVELFIKAGAKNESNFIGCKGMYYHIDEFNNIEVYTSAKHQIISLQRLRELDEIQNFTIEEAKKIIAKAKGLEIENIKIG